VKSKKLPRPPEHVALDRRGAFGTVEITQPTENFNEAEHDSVRVAGKIDGHNSQLNARRRVSQINPRVGTWL
jgi:hypothetical protein